MVSNCVCNKEITSQSGFKHNEQQRSWKHNKTLTDLLLQLFQACSFREAHVINYHNFELEVSYKYLPVTVLASKQIVVKISNLIFFICAAVFQLNKLLLGCIACL